MLQFFHGDFTKRRVSHMETLKTLVVIVTGLFTMEHIWRFIFLQLSGLSPILLDQSNRHILSRHFSVDFTCCAIVSVIGFIHRAELKVFTDKFFGHRKTVPKADMKKRLFGHSNAGHQIALFYLSFQFKNMYDTIVWNDGPEFIMHHLLSGLVAYFALHPGFCHVYAIFFMGVSEFSTAVLSLLANFDEDGHGVVGLAQVFPMTKMILASTFAPSFVVCRIIAWPFIGYYFCRDCFQALELKTKQTNDLKYVMYYFLFVIVVLTLLQFFWLGEIVKLSMRELKGMGLLN